MSNEASSKQIDTEGLRDVRVLCVNSGQRFDMPNPPRDIRCLFDIIQVGRVFPINTFGGK